MSVISYYQGVLTQAVLKHYLSYDPDTGIFTRLIRTSSQINVGDIAGSLGANGYISIRVLGRTYRANRLAWLYVYGSWPKREVDHINGIKVDNSISNLRDVSKSANQHNRPGARGTYREPRGKNPWRSKLVVNRVQHIIGWFPSEAEAHEAYKAAKAALYKPQDDLCDTGNK